MIFGLYYKSAFLLFYFTQGLIFSFVLLFKGNINAESSSRWLSFLIFLSCLYITPWMLGHAGWYAKDGYREFLFFVPFQQFFLIGPVIFFYTKTLLNPAYVFSKKDLLHFVPALIYLLYSGIVFIVDALVLDEFYFYADGRDKDLSPWYQIMGHGAIITYVSFSISLYNKYRIKIFEELSFAESVIYNWIRQFLISLLIILIVKIFFLILLPEWGDFGHKWWYYFFFSCIFYYIAFSGYANSIKTSISHLFIQKQELSASFEVKEIAPIEHNELESWMEKIEEFMEQENGFKNPTLTLLDVANALDTTTKRISSIINSGYNSNFNDFVNSYRVAEIKERLSRGDQNTFTLLSIALDSGFNSKTTFNRAFKKQTNKTPNQYISNLKNSSAKS